MNVFFLSDNPLKAAEFHQDIHVRKMIMESAQLLSTAHRLEYNDIRPVLVKSQKTNVWEIKKRWYVHPTDTLDHSGPHPYPKVVDRKYFAATHMNHPCAKWVRENKHNYNWLWVMFFKLCDIYKYRMGEYGKPYASARLIDPCSKVPVYLPDSEGISAPALAMPEEVIRESLGIVSGSLETYSIDEAVAAYRHYYKESKSSFTDKRGRITYASWKGRKTPYWWKRSSEANNRHWKVSFRKRRRNIEL